MAGKPPGPTCSSRLGPNWIDDGTLCRTRSGASGPLGLVMSLVMGAAPREKKVDNEAQEARKLFAHDIDVIAGSPFGRTKEGQEIVQLLRSLNAGGDIAYGGTLDDSRGDWDGKTIRVNESARGQMFRTISELVHEASHALWRKVRRKRNDAKERLEDDVADELHARENQLIIYKYLKEAKGCPEDWELELRLSRQANGTLKATIQQLFEP